MKQVLLTTALVGLMAVPGFADTHEATNGEDEPLVENGDMTGPDADTETDADTDTGVDADTDIETGADAETGADVETGGEVGTGGPVDVAELSADDLMGADVMSADDERVAGVDDVLLDGQGEIESILFDVGGFLGIGAQTVEVAVADFQIVEVDGAMQVQLDLTEEQIEDLPEYEG